MRIYDLIPDADVLSGLAPEELAFSLLRVATSNLQHGSVHRNVVIDIDPMPPNARPYPQQREAQVVLALTEALHWLEINAFLLPSPGQNGINGFRVIGRRGREYAERPRFDTFMRAAAFPKSLLHPLIADRVWIDLARGDFAGAVFFAFRTVEEETRNVCGYPPTEVGVQLVRRAFDPANGPLSNQTQPLPEREALSHLLAGAIGSYKNPHSHRTVTIDDHVEAQEMVMLASHLLRIIDSRRQ